ncbi:GH25 family lysozyme [Massilistercora timonensis]|uniref:GH25 family lysozyme n=1 Tax=Massilistercora timonensis TaxID=2086584 RepID=UPI00320A3B73
MRKKTRIIAFCLTICIVCTSFQINVSTAIAENLSDDSIETEIVDEGENVSETNDVKEEGIIEKENSVKEIKESKEEAESENSIRSESKEQVKDKNNSSYDRDGDPGEGRLQGYIPKEFYGPLVKGRSGKVQHDDRFETGYSIDQGIDVSQFNGVIDWEAVKEAGIKFAIIRLGRRTYGSGTLGMDTKAIENIKGATEAGIPVGVYIFSQAITTKEARQEANYVLNRIKGYDIKLPIVMDFEYASDAGGLTGRLYEADLSKSEATNICLDFCERIEEYGYTPMVYANADMLRNGLNADKISSLYKIWLAHYTNKTDYEGEYSFWQYSSTGKVDGITGNVDMNYRYIKQTIGTPKLVSVKATEKGVILEWEKASGADGYRVFRKTEGSSWQTIAVCNNTIYEDESVSMNTLYTYTVRAFKGNYEEADANKYSGEYWGGYDTKGISISLLGVPELTSVGNTVGGIRVNWKAVDGAAGYYVYRKEKGGSSWKKIDKASGTSYTDGDELESGNTYVYTVRAYNGSNISSYDQTGLTALKLDVPELLSVSNSGTIKVSWKAVKGAKEYHVYRKTPGDHWNEIGITEETTYSDTTGLVSGEEYLYTVRAHDGESRSYYDENGVGLLYLEEPELTSVGNTVGGIRVNWKAVDGAAGYYVYRKEKGGSSWKKIDKASGTSYTDGDELESGNTYVYTVRAYNGSNISSYDQTGLTALKLDVPELLSVSNSGTIKVSWKAVKGAKEYHVYRKTPGDHWNEIGITEETTYSDTTGLVSGEEYLYTVRAHDGESRSYYDENGVGLLYLEEPELTSVGNTVGGIRVNWKAVDGAAGYYVYRKEKGGSSWKKIDKASGTSYTDGDELESGNTYVYTVRAYNGSNISSYDQKGLAVKKK